MFTIDRKFFKDLWTALRALSLSLAVASTGMGMLFAHRFGYLDPGSTEDRLKIFLVLLAGLSAQAGTNLVNDFFEGSFKYHRPEEKTYSFLGYERTAFDLLVFAWSLASFGLAALIGLYLMITGDLRLFFFGAAGILGGYAYTGEPIVYKKRGLGAPLSFLLMGPLMVLGAYFVFAHRVDLSVVLLTLPATLFIPLLMFSNELRDYHRDLELGVKTAVVRLGFQRGKTLFIGLISASYLMICLFVATGQLPAGTLLTLFTLPMARTAYRSTSKSRKEGIPATNFLTIAFHALFLLGFFISA